MRHYPFTLFSFLQQAPNAALDVSFLSSPSLTSPSPAQVQAQQSGLQSLEDVQLEFGANIQDKNESNSMSTVDFFNNLRIGDDFAAPTYTSSETSFSVQTLNERLDHLHKSSAQNGSVLVNKQKWEGEAISLHTKVWSFENEQRQAVGYCGCGNNVLYSYLH